MSGLAVNLYRSLPHEQPPGKSMRAPLLPPLKEKRHKPWRLTLVFLVPPFLQCRQREPTAMGRPQEIGDVMHEGLYLGRLPTTLIVRDDSLVLPVGMKFATEKPSAFHQHASGLRKNARKVSDMFEDE